MLPSCLRHNNMFLFYGIMFWTIKGSTCLRCYQQFNFTEPSKTSLQSHLTCGYMNLGMETFSPPIYSLFHFENKTKNPQQFFMDRTFQRIVNSRKWKYLYSHFVVALKIKHWTVTANLTQGASVLVVWECFAPSDFTVFILLSISALFLKTPNYNFH